jgi:glycosyltransferase involved in cell wall biosynthesis
MILKPKIIVDSRRKINSGVGRISQWLFDNLKNSSIQSFKIYYLVCTDSLNDYNIDNENVIITNIKPFSSEEIYELPKLIASENTDLYINPQTTWSPFHATPSINIIHDLWAIKNPEWLPTYEDLKYRFGIENLSYFETLSKWFTDKKAKKLLTEYGYHYWLEALASENLILKGAWAQYAATVSLSTQAITVSTFIASEIKKYFAYGSDVITIHNNPKNSLNIPRQNPKHFLTLSKLEKRKNLLFLLEAYVKYADRKKKETYPLIIAGDPGYKSAADEILNKIDALKKLKYNIIFKPSVTDKELSQLLSESVALIYPTHFEGFGLPPLEAMLLGIPVLATKTGMMATNLGKYKIEIDPFNVVDLTQKMLDISEAMGESSILKESKILAQEFIANHDAKEAWISLINDNLK